MNAKMAATIALVAFALVVMLGAWWQAQAQDAKTPYPSMAPIDQYLIGDRNDEIAMARSAAPEAIAGDAKVLVLARHGYETAIKGKNGFVCLVERSWMSPFDSPEFWNPKLRGPICFNPPAARRYQDVRPERTAIPGARRHDLHDVESRVPCRRWRALDPPSDVLRSTNRRSDLGCRRVRITRFAESTISWCSGANHCVHDSGAQVVGRNACADGCALTS
jgi:hypothetical protein